MVWGPSRRRPAIASATPIVPFIGEVLGHSTVSFTVDVYTEVAGELAEAAAVAIAAYIPRAGRATSAKRGR